MLNQEAPEKRRARNLIVTSLFLFVLAGFMLGAFFHSQSHPAGVSISRPTSRPLGQTDEQYRLEVQYPLSDDPRHRQEARDARIKQALVLREHWKVWVAGHNDVLERAQKAPAGDEVAFQALLNALPPKGGPISHRDLMSGLVQFTWQPYIKARHVAPKDPTMRGQMLRGESFAMKLMHNDFKHYHDFVISQSMATGPSTIKFWASGRVTESNLVWGHIPELPGRRVEVDGPPQEISPPLFPTQNTSAIR